MQFSENWLRTFVNPALSSEQLSHMLTMAGLEVEEATPAAPVFNAVVVGEIIEAQKHPDADRLQVLKVNVGNDMLQIVCGAPNARVGLKAPCALVGATLPEFSIKEAKVRGVASFGMMCSARELGLSAEADGLFELPKEASVGQNIRKYLDLDDVIMTLKLTPNRADCLSIQGIARDVVAMTGAKLHPIMPEVVPITSSDQVPLSISANAACPLYYGRVIEGVNPTIPTPDWIKRRLERSGIRSLSVIVDITNYVLLELGQPLHAFDYNKIHGQIEVRYAKANESITLLNNQTVSLQSDDLIIADQQGPLALAGIMGGLSSAVSDETQSIFLESAFFSPDVMAGKARRLGLSTDASYRFERGVDYGLTQQALERATSLIISICGGNAGEQSSIRTKLPTRHPVRLRHARLESILGISIAKDIIAQLFTRLGMEFEEHSDVFSVTPPTYRFDIAREEDLIEEVVRLHGYDHVPAIYPKASIVMSPSKESERSHSTIRHAMINAGYQEVVTYSFVEATWETELMGNTNPIKLKNPIASNLSVMRSSIWGGLLEVLNYNLKRKQERAQLFEIGTTFHRTQEDFTEVSRLSGLSYGSQWPEQWAGASRDADFYDVKHIVEQLITGDVEFRPFEHTALHPGQSAAIFSNSECIGLLGKLHPKWQQRYELPKPVFLFELELSALCQHPVPQYAEVSKFLPVRRDLSILVDIGVAVQPIIDAVKAAKIPLLQHMQLFDVYQGKGVPDGKKSLAFLVLMQDTHKTLVDADTESAMAKLLDLLENTFGAQLR